MNKATKERELTEKQRKFIKEYLKDPNATQSAIKAGYSETSAYSTGCMLLKNHKIALELQRKRELIASKVDKYEITPEKVLKEFAKVGFADMGEFANWGEDGVSLRSSSELTQEQTSAVGEVTETRTTFGESGEKVTTKIKLADKLKALENLGKHLGLFKEQVNMVGTFQLMLPDDDDLLESQGTLDQIDDVDDELQPGQDDDDLLLPMPGDDDD